MTVNKRDGTIEEFSEKKIFDAIKKANNKVHKEDRLTDEQIDKVVKSTKSFIGKTDTVDVDQIHKCVENALMKNNCFDVAKQYILFRQERDKERFKKLSIVQEMKEKLDASNVQNQNANLDEYSFGGRKGEMDSTVLKQMALDYYISSKFAKNHINNRIYIHDLDSYVVGMHNCGPRNTKFYTKDGIKTFENFNDGDITEVLCKDGVYRPATVRYYGKKPMNIITFRQGNSKNFKKVIFTPDHRWILKDGTVTTSLNVNDQIALLEEKIVSSSDIKSKRNAEMFAFGFAIGDGCDKNNKYILVRLCGQKMQYKHIFEKAGYHKYSSHDNGDESFIKNIGIRKQDFLSNKMWNILSFEDKAFLFAGYYVADGYKTYAKGIATSDERVLNMIQDISYCAGYHIIKQKELIHDTNYKKDAKLYCVSFMTSQKDNTGWKVVSIKKAPQKEYDAWCFEEPVTHSFTLTEGLITGNCLSLPLDELLKKGANTRQAFIRPAGSVNTAFQLMAVFFQIQSLQQFGGVAATHVDWSFVPYVRKSFMKHFKDGLKFVEGLSDKEVDNIVNNEILVEDK